MRNNAEYSALCLLTTDYLLNPVIKIRNMSACIFAPDVNLDFHFLLREMIDVIAHRKKANAEIILYEFVKRKPLRRAQKLKRFHKGGIMYFRSAFYGRIIVIQYERFVFHYFPLRFDFFVLS